MSTEVLARWAPYVDRLVLLAAVAAALSVGWQVRGVVESRRCPHHAEHVEMPPIVVVGVSR